MAEYLIPRADGRTARAHAVRSTDGVWVFVEGDVFVIRDDRDVKRPGRDDQGTLSAPMPATVVAINVRPGDSVKAGDVLILLEAMKMELPVRAPRDAIVGRLHCQEGELVQPGVPLIELP